MDEFYNQEQKFLPPKPNKKELILGLITALALLGVSYILGIIFFLTPPGRILGFILSYIIPLILYSFVDFLIPVPLFLIINSIFLAFSKKGSGFRKGIKFGYLFLLIFVAVIALRYINILIAWHNVDVLQATEKLIDNGDASICDKMVVKEGWENKVPSTKQFKENCYISVTNWAVKTSDASNCDRLNNNMSSFNSCVLQIAQKNHDPSVCNKLNTDSLKENCYFVANH